MQPGHAVYCGHVGHKRFLPKQHGFDYAYTSYWLDTAMLEQAILQKHGISCRYFAAISYRRQDYLAGAADLYQAVCDKVALLGGQKAVAKVYVLTPLANWGYYFSPLTLYYCYDEQAEFCYLLAEVSNTPWNERHYYLQTIDTELAQYKNEKAFHVSPFNPMDMQYHWQIPQPGEQLFCSITNFKQQKAVFSAWFKLQRFTLDAVSRRRILIRHPWQNVQIMWRIYWQALKLFIKGVPFYSHSKSKGS